MSQRQADLILRAGGSTILVAEIKGRLISPAFHSATAIQIVDMLQRTGSRWAILADPVTIRVYHHGHAQPVAQVPTHTVLDAVDFSGTEVIGKGMLTLALRLWLEMLATTTGTKNDLPEALLRDLRTVDDVRELASID